MANFTLYRFYHIFLKSEVIDCNNKKAYKGQFEEQYTKQLGLYFSKMSVINDVSLLI